MTTNPTGRIYTAKPGESATVTDKDGARPLEQRSPYSPDGHNWGYGGAGPTALAYDILHDYLGERPALKLVHDFRGEFIQTSDRSRPFLVRGDVIAGWLASWSVSKEVDQHG